jgi:bifunctional DNase/RNase
MTGVDPDPVPEVDPEVGAGPGATVDPEAHVTVEPEPEVTPPPPAFRVMDVDAVSLDLPAQYPSVALLEAEPPLRTLVFPVGLTEGTALALALHKMSSPRPLTHELFAQVLQRSRLDIIAVRLTGRDQGNYLAELDLMTPHGRERIPCRPSDGLVLALRMPVPAPILVDERLLESAEDVEPQQR